MNTISLGRTKIIPLIVVGIALLLQTASGQVLDQSVLNQSTSGFSGTVLTSSNQLAQTFTVGITGQLSRIDLQVVQAGNTNPITQDLVLVVYLPLSSTNLLGTTLATVNIHPNDVPNGSQSLAGALVSVDLDPFSILVNAGDVLSLVLMSDQFVPNPAFKHYTWVTPGGTTNPYPGGQAWSNRFPAGFAPLTNRDFGFQTYVSNPVIITPVPEPSGKIFVVAGLAGLLLLRRLVRHF